jgi:1-acyl-sn-glycerol-3-phosphate acyltransferase
MFYRIANAFLRVAFRLLTRLEVTGVENVPLSGGLMVAMNHVSFLDPLLVCAKVPRRLVWMSKVENWDNRLFGVLLTLYGAFPVQRGEVDRKALARAIEVLRSGLALGIAPEGTRSRDWKLARAKPGAARLALQTGATILPVGIAGTEQAQYDWRKLRRPRIKMRIGKPYKQEAQRPISKEQQQELADEMMFRIAELLPPGYRGAYAERAPDGSPVETGSAPAGA